MSRTRYLPLMVLAIGPLVFLPTLALAAEGGETRPAPVQQGHALVQQHCSPCHSLRLVTAQRLDRANWEWVMDDMVNKYGARWITEELQKVIIDYLVEHYGPEK